MSVMGFGIWQIAFIAIVALVVGMFVMPWVSPAITSGLTKLGISTQ